MLSPYITFHARRRPSAPALCCDGESISFAELDERVMRVAAHLRTLGVKPKQRIALSLRDAASQFLIVLGLDRLGCAIGPVAASERGDIAYLPAHIDCCLTDFRPAEPLPIPVHTLEPKWPWNLTVLSGLETIPATEEEADDCVHLRMTSGTTGTPKSHAITRRMMIERIHERHWSFGLAPGSRFLALMPLTVGSVYLNTVTALFAGATVVFESRPLLETRTLESVTHITLMPGLLGQILDALPAGFRKPERLKIYSIGARLPPDLARRALERLAAEVLEVYGANETGTIAAVRDGGALNVLPQVDVRIVDDAGRVLPAGMVGRIAIRTPGMATQYEDDAVATARHFRDGWFLPGDLGVLRAPRQLELHGRVDDLLNVGGHKIAPSVFEEALRQAASGADVAVTSIAEPNGVDKLVVAVAQADFDRTQFSGTVSKVVGSSYGPILIIPLTAIPRNAAGKILRAELKAMAESIVQRGKPA